MEGNDIKRHATLALALTLIAICLFGQLAVPGLVCARAYADGDQPDLVMDFAAFSSKNTAVLVTRQAQTVGVLRAGNAPASGHDPRPMAYAHLDPVPLAGVDEPSMLRIRRIMPPHSILGPPTPDAHHPRATAIAYGK